MEITKSGQQNVNSIGNYVNIAIQIVIFFLIVHLLTKSELGEQESRKLNCSIVLVVHA